MTNEQVAETRVHIRAHQMSYVLQVGQDIGEDRVAKTVEYIIADHRRLTQMIIRCLTQCQCCPECSSGDAAQPPAAAE